MSQWTHVAGVIRLDTLAFRDKNVKQVLKSSFGNCISYESSDRAWAKCNVPCGSEGSVQYRIVQTSTDDYGVVWGLIYIWGDLRDYGDPYPIFEWIKDSINKSNNSDLLVRSCSIKIDVEFQKEYLIYNHYDEAKMVTNILMIEIPKEEIT